MSIIKKAHSLLLQARTETNPQKALLLKKASADYYSQIIAFSYIYGIVTGESNPNEILRYSQSGNLNDQVAKLIKEKQLLNGFENRLAKKLATEFFNTSNLATLNFHNKMLKSFSIALRSKEKAEDAIHNILTGLNPVTGREYSRVEEKNQFAYAGLKNEIVRNLFLATVEELNGNPNALIQSASDDIASGIFYTITLIETRLKHNRSNPIVQRSDSMEDIQQIRQTNRSVDEVLPPMYENFDALLITKDTINQLIELLQQGYGWKTKKSRTQRIAIAFFLFCMEVSFRKNQLQQLVIDEEEQELLNEIAISPANFMELSGLNRLQLQSVYKKLGKKLGKSSSDFLEELELIYADINPMDQLNAPAGDRAFQASWTEFLDEIGQDITAFKNGLDLPVLPGAENEIENASLIFKQGSKKKASLKNRVASLLRRYYQI